MKKSHTAPRITKLSWGCIKVEGAEKPYKDAKLFPGGSREWDWNETGTRHTPGIQPADVEELLQYGATVVILSRGFYERLQVAKETIALLQEKNIPFYILQTEKAVQRYNELRDCEKVGGLFHSTC
ncbi:MAG: Mth938-like domain-containing protein [Calditrichia bacterium]